MRLALSYHATNIVMSRPQHPIIPVSRPSLSGSPGYALYPSEQVVFVASTFLSRVRLVSIFLSRLMGASLLNTPLAVWGERAHWVTTLAIHQHPRQTPVLRVPRNRKLSRHVADKECVESSTHCEQEYSGQRVRRACSSAAEGERSCSCSWASSRWDCASAAAAASCKRIERTRSRWAWARQARRMAGISMALTTAEPACATLWRAHCEAGIGPETPICLWPNIVAAFCGTWTRVWGQQKSEGGRG